MNLITERYMSTENQSNLFISYHEAIQHCEKINNGDKILDFLIEKDIISYFTDKKYNNNIEQSEQTKYILTKDFNIFMSSINNLETDNIEIYSNFLVFPISETTFIKTNDKKFEGKYFKYDINSVIKNLFYEKAKKSVLLNEYKSVTFTKNNLEYQFISKSQSQLDNLKLQIDFLEKHLKNDFESIASPPNYLGKKKKIASFILNILQMHTTDKSVILDIMSGSGAIAGQTAKYWKTYSSDLQKYANVLSISQGRGFTEKEASILEKQLQSHIYSNLKNLEDKTKEYVDKEYNLLNSKVTEQLLEDYKKFLDTTPYYHEENNSSSSTLHWDPHKETLERKVNSTLFPYCLFTSYFSNCYFGFYQSIEIDSIRYAIDQIDNENLKTYALAALLMSISQLAQGYGGHLAQPLYTKDNITLKKIGLLLQKRSKSITSNFFLKLKELGKLSEQIKFPINSIPGPWENALDSVKKLESQKDVIVYLDPPYTTDEYGRYYHVFETLTKYNYPDSINKGRTPNKTKGERYNTEFTCKTHSAVESSMIKIIKSILDNGWTCVWSYASSGMVSIYSVLNNLNIEYNQSIEINTYSTKHNHTVQGKAPKKKNQNIVVEYVIVIKKKL